MDVNWSALDGVLGLLLVIVLIWVGLKFVARLALAVLAVLVIGALFFGLHVGDFT
jgi:hypothetical protein